MANVERLTKRVKKIEEWIEENEGGPTLDNINWLLETLRNASNQVDFQNRNMQTLQNLHREFFEKNELLEDWNEFIAEKDNAVQEQQTEEVSVQEEAENSEEASEAQEEEKE